MEMRNALYWGDVNHFRHMVFRRHYWVMRRGIGLAGVRHTLDIHGYLKAAIVQVP